MTTDFTHAPIAECFCDRGLLTAGEEGSRFSTAAFSPAACNSSGTTSSGNVELTFLGHPFESLGRTLDPILAVIAIGRQQPDHLIGAAGGRTGDIAGSKIDGLSNSEFVLQRPLHHERSAGDAHGPAAIAG